MDPQLDQWSTCPGWCSEKEVAAHTENAGKKQNARQYINIFVYVYIFFNHVVENIQQLHYVNQSKPSLLLWVQSKSNVFFFSWNNQTLIVRNWVRKKVFRAFKCVLGLHLLFVVSVFAQVRAEEVTLSLKPKKDSNQLHHFLSPLQSKSRCSPRVPSPYSSLP